ncbi:YihY family inner membrane protein [Permianibacter aggregans]|uniref:UPF0761 membrane protein EV696_11749 n=1 Tax=Permianibacter aggregans TaxID=1510150 RepID=A0A4R6UID1_9GAMM|nr:YihY family inner membrane protein [Permianibacter aggregans]TDQ45816.1 membrane protein [Permianibacter aggregans]
MVSEVSWQLRRDWFVGMIRFVFRRFGQDRCQAVAANLTITSLLALVPLFTVIAGMFNLLPGMQSAQKALGDFLFTHFLPTSGTTLQKHLEEFVDRAGQLQFAGFVFLFVTALLLMNTIDKALNEIWGSLPSRRLGRKWLVYWALLTAGPILIGSGLAVSSYLFSLPYFSDAATFAGGGLLRLVPPALTIVGFWLLYMWVPNRNIVYWHALISATVAALLFELSKRAFGYYISSVPTYEVIFGAMAVLPILVIWVYLSWAIILFGAELCHAIGSFKLSTGRITDPFIVAVRLIGDVLAAQSRGRLVKEEDLLSRAESENAEVVFTALEERGWLGRVREEEICFARDPELASLYDMRAEFPWRMPNAKDVAKELGIEHPMAKELIALEKSLKETMKVPVKELLKF